MSRDIRNGDAEGFLQKLEALFAKTSYQIQGDSEKIFQYAMYILLELMGEYVEVEKATSNGRIDLLLQARDFVYIIEIKINDTVEAALRQIEEKGYARRFADDKRRIFIPAAFLQFFPEKLLSLQSDTAFVSFRFAPGPCAGEAVCV